MGKVLWKTIMGKNIMENYYGKIEKRYIVLVKSWGGVKPWQQYKG